MFSEAVKKMRRVVYAAVLATAIILAALMLAMLDFGNLPHIGGAVAALLWLAAALAIALFAAWSCYRLCKHITRRTSHCLREGLPRPYPRVFTGIAWRVCAYVRRLRQHTPDNIADRALSPVKKALQLAVQWMTQAARKMAKPYYTEIKRQCLIDAASLGEPDVIHCHDLWALPVGAAVKKKTGAILVWDAHEIYEEVAQGNEEHARMCRSLMRAHEKDVDEFITINDSIAAFYQEKYPKLPKATIIKNATLYSERVSYDGRLHEAAGLPLTQKIALYQGGFAEKRGLRLLVSMAAGLDPDWTLVMMGWGKLEAELKESAASILSETAQRDLPAVAFLPPAKQDELVYWTAGGTVGLIPYENVGLNHLYCTPNKLWEYPAAGVPILCSPLVEMTKSVRENGTGWTLPEESDPKAIASIINNLAPDAIEQARAACYAYIEEDNWSKYGKRLVQLYERLRKQRQGG
jgi:glycosyltransferase involved in cell wall biosynthesis